MNDPSLVAEFANMSNELPSPEDPFPKRELRNDCEQEILVLKDELNTITTKQTVLDNEELRAKKKIARLEIELKSYK